MEPVERAFDIEAGFDGEAPEDLFPAVPPPPFQVPATAPAAAALARIVSGAVDPAELEGAGPYVLAKLLAIETRPDRFQRLLRTWIGKINEAIQRGDVEGVVQWMNVVVRDLDVADDLAASRATAIAELTAPLFLEAVVVALVDRADADLADQVLRALGTGAVDTLVEWMAVDDPPVSRRHIVDLLALAGRHDVRALAVHLGDDRWFVVRNIAIALGKTGRAQAVDPLLMAVDHDDDRVRVEALRSLTALQGDRAVSMLLGALSDPSRRVRQAVVSLLRASPSRLVVPGVVDAVEAGSVGADEAAVLVELIAERRDDAVEASLQRLAAGRFVVGARRAARDAARTALAKRAS